MTRPILRATAVALVLLVAGKLHAAPVHGEDIPLNVDGSGTPTDPKIAEVHRFVQVTYDSPGSFEEPVNGPIVIEMQCTSRVYRSETSGFLTFETFWNDVEPSQIEGFGEGQTIGDVSDYSGFAINGFGIVEGSIRHEIISDSAGSNPGAASTAPGGDLDAPRFVLATNATRFDQNGKATAHGGDEALVRIIGTDQTTLGLVVGDMAVDHIFEPTAAIPLPPAVYPASAILGLMLVTHITRTAGRKLAVVVGC